MPVTGSGRVLPRSRWLAPEKLSVVKSIIVVLNQRPLQRGQHRFSVGITWITRVIFGNEPRQRGPSSEERLLRTTVLG